MPVVTHATQPQPRPLVLALAPMEGVTDDLVREIYAELGGVDYCVTEFLRVTDPAIPAKVLLRDCPELAHGGRTRAGAGVPVHVQLLGGDAGRVAESARTAAELGAMVIDLNFGCPAPTVNRHDGGATLLRDPCRVEDVVRAVRDAVPAGVPVSAKVRLGWDDPDAIVGIARAAEAGGAAWITVHARTRAQGYKPPVDWVRVGRARASVAIPVVANGDIASPEDLRACREASGCDRFMLGRGAIARPEIFRVLRGLDARWWTGAERIAVLERYAERSLAQGEGRARITLGRVKQWARAMDGAVDGALVGLFDAVKRIEDIDAMRAALSRERLARSGAGSAAA